MSEKNPEAPADIESDLQRKLLRRVAFAGLLIAALLGALALIDHIGKSPDLVEDEGPVFHAPVPVGKKEVTQPVTPVEQLPPAGEEVPPAPPAAPAATEPSAATPEPPPEKPEVAARPMLPPPPPETRPSARSGGSPALLRTPRLPEPPAEGSAPARIALPGNGAAELPPAAAAAPAATASVLPRPPSRSDSPPPAPPRLFSGYAVQAGVFSEAAHAEELRARLTLNGIPSTLEARVQIGPFKTRAEAEAARQKLQAIGVEGIVLPPRNARR